MIPESGREALADALTPDFTADDRQPSRTYRMDPTTHRIQGMCDGLTAIRQAIYKTLSTERYRHAIYSWGYGVRLDDLYGRHLPYVLSEVELRITEVLLADSRIKAVEGFQVSHHGGDVSVTFTAHTAEGLVEIVEEEVLSGV